MNLLNQSCALCQHMRRCLSDTCGAVQESPTDDSPDAIPGQSATDIPAGAYSVVDAIEPAGVAQGDGGAPTEPGSARALALPAEEAETPQPAAEDEPSAVAEEPAEPEAAAGHGQEEAKPTSLFGRAAAAVAAVSTVRPCRVLAGPPSHRAPCVSACSSVDAGSSHTQCRTSAIQRCLDKTAPMEASRPAPMASNACVVRSRLSLLDGHCRRWE